MLPAIARHSEKFFYFYEIANEGSLQATARKLGISAPSLSHAVKQLEAVAGAQLFHRSQSGVTLTVAGEKLFAFCRKYYREMEEVQRLIAHPDDKSVRKLKIGTFQSIALYFWPLLIDSMAADAGLSFSITTNRSHAILEALLRKEVDIALTVGSPPHEKLIRHELYEDRYAFYVASTWEKAEMKQASLQEHALLYIPDAADEDAKSLRQYVRAWGLVFRDEFDLDSLEIVGEFVKRGYGIGILPSRVAKALGNALKPLNIDVLESQIFGCHRFYLSYRDDLEMPQTLVRLLLDTAKRATLQLNA